MQEIQKEVLTRVMKDLGEHFDSVQLSVSVVEQGDTHIFHIGSGNWYARQGMCNDFINQELANAIAYEQETYRQNG